jgi:hypothetical protein
MKFLFGKWQHWLRHATSKPYPAKKYKLQSGDNLVSNILQASAPPSIPPSALNLPNTTGESRHFETFFYAKIKKDPGGAGNPLRHNL